MRPGVGDQLRVRPEMPERQGKHAHQRVVAVRALLGRAGRESRSALAERPERGAGRDADVEDATVGGESAEVVPFEQEAAQILGVEPPRSSRLESRASAWAPSTDHVPACALRKPAGGSSSISEAVGMASGG